MKQSATGRIRQCPGRQDGVALAAGMMILLIITVIGVFSMRSSIFELRMARNEESRMTAFQRAESLVESFLSFDGNFVALTAGDTLCYDATDGACTMSVDADLVAAEHLLRSTALSTFVCYRSAPRILSMSEGSDVFLFDVEATYDAVSAKQGRASVVQGVMDVANVGGTGSTSQSIMVESSASGAGAGACS